jgi:hypothetical protein
LIRIDGMRGFALLLTMTLTAACSGTGDPLPGVAPDVTFALMPVAGGAGGEPSLLVIPHGAAQVGFRLVTEITELDHLTAEITGARNPDDARRWRVDAAPAAGDGATAMVTLPAHALPTDEYVLTLWEGDATAVATFVFRTRKD